MRPVSKGCVQFRDVEEPFLAFVRIRWDGRECGPTPAPDLIPAETEKQTRTYIRIGTANGGTSLALTGLSEG